MDEIRRDVPEVNPEVHHEERDVNVRIVLWIIAIFIVVAILIHVSIGGLFKLFKAQEKEKPQEPMTLIRQERQLPIVPLLQPFPYKASGEGESPLLHTPVTDMATLRREQAAHLNSYGWVDPQRGVVRIPIERARRLFVLRSGGGGTVTVAPSTETAAPQSPKTAAAGGPRQQ